MLRSLAHTYSTEGGDCGGGDAAGKKQVTGVISILPSAHAPALCVYHYAYRLINN